ncbi:hypothetical protein LSAT2_013347 [Lamellibrachia satsuma]|nr:hypothetical protein LSAT2_013347 [Lamellibrachia satsuma]
MLLSVTNLRSHSLKLRKTYSRRGDHHRLLEQTSRRSHVSFYSEHLQEEIEVSSHRLKETIQPSIPSTPTLGGADEIVLCCDANMKTDFCRHNSGHQCELYRPTGSCKYSSVVRSIAVVVVISLVTAAFNGLLDSGGPLG